MEMKNNLYSPGSSGWTSLRNPEFQEADIWEIFKENVPESGATISFDQDLSFASKRPPITWTRTIKIPNKTSSYPKGPKISQHSAPVNIPNWSKIYGSGSKNISRNNSYSWLSPDSDVDLNCQRWESRVEYEEEEEIGSGSKNTSRNNSYSWLSPDSDVDHLNCQGWESRVEYEEEGEKGNNVIPPHEWIASKVSRSETFSFSVCEGAGRTLKGRDLCRVRNAVLTKTGFLEPNSRY